MDNFDYEFQQMEAGWKKFSSWASDFGRGGWRPYFYWFSAGIVLLALKAGYVDLPHEHFALPAYYYTSLNFILLTFLGVLGLRGAEKYVTLQANQNHEFRLAHLHATLGAITPNALADNQEAVAANGTS